MRLKLPGFLADNPVESMIAAALLLGLLLISADGTNPLPAAQKPFQVASGKS